MHQAKFLLPVHSSLHGSQEHQPQVLQFLQETMEAQSSCSRHMSAVDSPLRHHRLRPHEDKQS